MIEYNLLNVASENKILSEEERDALHDVLSNYKLLFYGTPVAWKTKPVDKELHTYEKNTMLIFNHCLGYRKTYKKELEKI